MNPKPPPLSIALLLMCFAVCSGSAQGSFQNLSFESAVIMPVPGGPAGSVQFAPAFPGWACTVNGQAQNSALYDNLTITPALALYGSGAMKVEGNYSAVFQATTLFLPSQVSLFQSGLIPADSRSLQFLATSPGGLGDGQFTVSLNGSALSLSVLQDFGSYSLYGSDITSFAGQNVQLRFDHTVAPSGISVMTLDAINFSPTAVPEPTAGALLALGGLAAWCVGRRRR